MLNQETKRRIDSARDILVGKVPDPKAQVEQITTAMIYKFMDDMDKEAQELGGKARFFTNGYEKYSWTNIMDPKLGGHERLNIYAEAVVKMAENPHIPQLFRDIFKDSFLPYRSPETLSMFLKEINGFKYLHSEDLGDAFEYLLSVLGSQGDAGQFRTPRHIIDFIADVVDPKKDDSILDPACGTAGFLISAYKHILKQHKDKPLSPEDKKRMMNHIVGYDISPDMVKLSKVNMYLHGFPTPHIFEYDTLSSEEKWDETYDVIMANPPFMTPKGGIRPHKRFSVQANRAEVLFVNYIMEHLNNNGRAGIIVPEGIIFQSANAYKALRKMLVEENYLYAVVSLPAGVFNPYAGVKTSILFLDKQIAKQTKEILFVKVEQDGFDLGAQRRIATENDLPRALKILNEWQKNYKVKESANTLLIENGNSLLTESGDRLLLENQIYIEVKKDRIVESGEYNLSGERYREVKVNLNQKWPMVKLKEISEISSGNSAPQEKELFERGIYSFFRTSDVGIVHISNHLIKSRDRLNEKGIRGLKLFPKNTILFPKSGASTFLNHRAMLGISGYVSSHLATIIPDETKILPNFLFNLLVKIDAKKLTSDQNYPSLKTSEISKIKIPLPPLEVQEEIIEEMEVKQKAIDAAKEVIENLQRERQYFGKTLGKVKNIKWTELGDICTLEYGKPLKEENRQAGDYPVFGSNGIVGYHNKYLVKGPFIIVGRKGSAGKITFSEKNGFPIDTTFYVKLLNKSAINLKYLYLIMQTLSFDKINTQSGVPGLNRNDAYKVKLPLPSLELQKILVDEINIQEEFIKSNKKMIKIFEKKIEEKINEVWGE